MKGALFQLQGPKQTTEIRNLRCIDSAVRESLAVRRLKFQTYNSSCANVTTFSRVSLNFLQHRSQKKVDTGSPTDNGVDDVTLQVKTTTLAAKQTTPAVHIDVSEHAEDQGNTHTEVREVNTSKVDGDTVKQTKEVTKVSKTSTPGGGQVTTQTKQTTTKTTRKGFVGE